MYAGAGLHYCQGLHQRHSSQHKAALKAFNLARKDSHWYAFLLIPCLNMDLTSTMSTIMSTIISSRPPFSSVQPQPALRHSSDSCSNGIGTDITQLLGVQKRQIPLSGLSVCGGTSKFKKPGAYHQAFLSWAADASEPSLSVVPTVQIQLRRLPVCKQM